MVPPVSGRELEGVWYTGIYYKTKGTLCIGCVSRCFLTEEDGPVNSIEVDCLKPVAWPSSMTLKEPPQHLGKNNGVLNATMQIAGQLTVT